MSGTLLVPVALDAMVVTRRAQGLAFRRWRQSYTLLDTFNSPDAPAFDRNDDQFGVDPAHAGVYLMWTLPDALRRGVEQPDGTMRFPPLPNRWLVTRWSGGEQRKTRFWMVESDWLGPGDGFAVSENRQARPRKLGRVVAIGDWRESGGPAFLTVESANGPLGLGYQPQAEDVLSLVDRDFDDVDPGQPLSYQVIGWHSRPQDDVLSWYRTVGGEADQDPLAALNWRIDDGSSDQPGGTGPDRCLYHGMIHSVPWDPQADSPTARPAASDIKIALGPTAADAVRALLLPGLSDDPGHRRHVSTTLAAAVHGLLDAMDAPDGLHDLRETVHDSAFGATGGATRWEIEFTEEARAVAAPGAPLSPPTSAEVAALATLNARQRAWEGAAAALSSLQRDLHELWWSLRYYQANNLGDWGDIDGFDPDAAARQLDPATGGLAARVAAARERARQLTAARDQARQAAEAGLDKGRALRAVAQPRFRRTADPVLAMMGANHDPMPGGTALICRLPERILSAFDVDGGRLTVQAVTAGVEMPPLDPLPVADLLAPLLREAFLLDPGAIPALARITGLAAGDIAAVQPTPANPQGSPPAAPGLRPWRAPWLPLYLEWEVEWHGLPYRRADGGTGWRFDGFEYLWTGGPGAEPVRIGGRSMLAAGASRLYTGAMRSAFGSELPESDCLAQSLEGLHSRLAVRDPAAHRVADDGVVSRLVDERWSIPLLSGDQAAVDTFEGIRSGHMRLTRLQLVDRFGQAVILLDGNNELEFRPYRAEQFIPQIPPAGQPRPERFVQLPPRLLQDARVDFVFMAHDADRDAHEQPGDTPVCGWLLPNHVDHSLVVFSPTGAPLGLLRRGSVADGVPLAWDTLPDSPAPTIASVAVVSSHLGAFLAGLEQGGAAAFAGLLDLLDLAYWSMDDGARGDDGFVSTLIGRPVALVRAEIGITLAETPIPHPAWANALTRRPARFAAYDFPARLGDGDDRGDGLIGFFLDKAYDRLYSPNVRTATGWVAPGESAPLSLRCQGPQEPPPRREVTLLMEPHIPIHVQTGLLPVKEIRLSSRWIDPALKAMEVPLRSGPLLCTWDWRTDGTDGATERVVRMPCPASTLGQWLWSQPTGGPQEHWTHYAVEAAGQQPLFPPTPPTLNSGLLRLRGTVPNP